MKASFLKPDFLYSVQVPGRQCMVQKKESEISEAVRHMITADWQKIYFGIIDEFEKHGACSNIQFHIKLY